MVPLSPSISESSLNSNSRVLAIPNNRRDEPVIKQEFVDVTDNPVFKQEFVDVIDHPLIKQESVDVIDNPLFKNEYNNDQVPNIKQELIEEMDHNNDELLIGFMNSDIANNENVDLWSIGKCIFCKGKIEEDSKILKCLHIICKDCTKRETTDSGIWCKCKIVTKGELIDYSIMAPNQSQVKICCEKNCQVVAKKICMHCKSVYCKPCSKTHSIKNKDHNPALMLNYPLKKEFVPCPKCMKKSVEVFCTKCSIMICAICHLNFHQKHNFNLLSTMAVETKAELQTLLTDISKENNHLNFIRQMTNEKITKLKSEKKKINDKIDERIKMIHEEADKRGLELKKLLETNFTNAVNDIKMNNTVINDFGKENDYYYSLTSSVINWDKIVECIKLSKIIKDQMVIAKRHTQEAATCKAELIYNDEQSVKKIVESIQGMGDIISSKIVSSSEFKITVDSNKVLQTLENDQSPILRSEPIMIQPGVSKLEADSYEMTTDENTDSADFKPPEISNCNQFTKELINSTSCNRSYHNDRHIPSLAKELKPKDIHNIDTMTQQQQQPPQQQQQQLSSQPQMNHNQKRSNEQTDEDDCQSNEGFVVKMLGLSWAATADDIIKFLSILGEAKVKDGASGVHFTMTTEGNPSGQAYVEMESEENLTAALKKDGCYMRNRCIRVFRSKRSEMKRAIKKTGSTLDSALYYDNCVHIRGLPFGFTKDEIVEFFQGLEMAPDGITIATNSTGRIEAFVQFVNKENVEEALKKHRKKIRDRYIEVFRSSLAEICKQALLQTRPRQIPYDRMDRFASSGGGSGNRGRYSDMSMRSGRNMKSFGSGRGMGGPRGGGRSSTSSYGRGNSFWDKDIFSA